MVGVVGIREARLGPSDLNFGIQSGYNLFPSHIVLHVLPGSWDLLKALVQCFHQGGGRAPLWPVPDHTPTRKGKREEEKANRDLAGSFYLLSYAHAIIQPVTDVLSAPTQ